MPKLAPFTLQTSMPTGSDEHQDAKSKVLEVLAEQLDNFALLNALNECSRQISTLFNADDGVVFAVGSWQPAPGLQFESDLSGRRRAAHG